MGPCSLTGRPRRLRAIPASRRSIWASRSMPELLTIERLSTGYGEAVVLNAISLTLAEGQSLALLGRNGMGKTTLINSIVGVTRFISGRIGLDGRDITPLRPDPRAHAGIGWGPPGRDTASAAVWATRERARGGPAIGRCWNAIPAPPPRAPAAGAEVEPGRGVLPT